MIFSIKKLKKWSKIIREDCDWDYIYLLKIERQKIQNMKNYLAEYRFPDIISKMDLCLRILNIIIGEEIENPTYVNDRNIKRFFSNIDLEYLRNLKEKNPLWYYNEIRNEKAWKLYYKLREQYTRSWWV